MELVLGIIVGLIALTLLVVVHELGHAIVARRNGVIVEEFAVGFPPRAWAKKVSKSFLGKNVDYSVNWLPFGGFVKLKGEYDSASKKGDYGAASYWVKTKILLAGVLMNWLTAVVLFTILAWVGLPLMIANQFTVPSDTQLRKQPITIASVLDDYPAAKAGLQKNDEIISVAGKKISTTDELVKTTKQFAGQKVRVDYKRSGDERSVDISLRNGSKANLGVSPAQRSLRVSTWSAPIVGVGLTTQLTWENLKAVVKLASDFFGGVINQLSFDENVRKIGGRSVAEAGKSVAGPIAIFGLIFPNAQKAGLPDVLLVMAILSIALAVLNVLPLPALDGGRWFTMTVFRLLKKPLTKQIEERIQVIGFVIIMILIVLVTAADVGKIIK